ncbi:MAG: hypothetical protein KA141_02880 [Rubrivivax sp.]|jgi:hypothetical protein|nr:hypothetical protein [Rubrivivax sp.]
MTLHRLTSKALACAAVALPVALVAPAHAAELYVPMGVPGIGLGLALPMGPMFGVRADFMTLGKREKAFDEDGIQYNGKVKLNRGALLMDVFPFSGSFRLTVGATSNTYDIALDASGAGGTLEIGNTVYTTTAADGLNVGITFPKTTPYVGIGWGHQEASGFRFSFDVGAAIGKATLTATARGALANKPGIQADIDKELAELRDGVGKVRAIPQISISLGYSF